VARGLPQISCGKLCTAVQKRKEVKELKEIEEVEVEVEVEDEEGSSLCLPARAGSG
jgi:hypothetical protein